MLSLVKSVESMYLRIVKSFTCSCNDCEHSNAQKKTFFCPEAAASKKSKLRYNVAYYDDAFGKPLKHSGGFGNILNFLYESGYNSQNIRYKEKTGVKIAQNEVWVINEI